MTRLATTYGAQAWGSPATDWCGAPSGNGRFSIQGCGGDFRRLTSEWDPPSVARKADFYRRGSFHTSEGGGGVRGGVLTLHGAAGGHPPVMFPVASALPNDEPQLDSWQVIVIWVDETPAGDSSEQESPCDSQNRRRPMDMNNSLNSLVHTVVQGGLLAHKEKSHLRCWFSIMLTLLVGMLLFGRSYWARLAQKLKSHLRCWFLFMLTLLASVLLFTALRVCGSVYLRSRNHLMVTD